MFIKKTHTSGQCTSFLDYAVISLFLMIVSILCQKLLQTGQFWSLLSQQQPVNKRLRVLFLFLRLVHLRNEFRLCRSSNDYFNNQLCHVAILFILVATYSLQSQSSCFGVSSLIQDSVQKCGLERVEDDFASVYFTKETSVLNFCVSVLFQFLFRKPANKPLTEAC